MTQGRESSIRPAIVGALNLMAVEHLRNIILDRDTDGVLRLSHECPFCRDIMEWADDDAT